MILKAFYKPCCADMSLSWKGVNAVQRNAVFYSMTSRDHPVFALYRDQYRANPGEATTVALRIRSLLFSLVNSDPFTLFYKDHHECVLGLGIRLKFCLLVNRLIWGVC